MGKAVVAPLLGLALVACGGGGVTSPSEPTSTPPTVAAPTPSPAPGPTPAAQTLTGVWRGTLIETQPDGCVQDHTLQLDLTQSGSDVTGSGVAVVGARSCHDSPGASFPGPVSGSVSAAAVELRFQNAVMTGTVSGNTMSGTFRTNEGDTGTWSVTR